MENIQKIEELLKNTNLDDEKKKDFMEFISSCKEDMINELIPEFEKNPKLIEFVYDNYSSKKEAFINADKEALTKIFEGEVDKLESVEES